MKPIRILLLSALCILFGLASRIHAQPVITEVVKATTPAQDSKLNDKHIPDVIPLHAEFREVIILRFKYLTDLLKGLEEAVDNNHIKNAVILSGIGSVRNYHIHTVSNTHFPSKNLYIKDDDAPADITSMNGYIIDGRVHVHISLANEEKAFGGHLEPGTSVFTFAILTLGILPDDLDLTWVDDKTYR